MATTKWHLPQLLWTGSDGQLCQPSPNRMAQEAAFSWVVRWYGARRQRTARVSSTSQKEASDSQSTTDRTVKARPIAPQPVSLRDYLGSTRRLRTGTLRTQNAVFAPLLYSLSLRTSWVGSPNSAGYGCGTSSGSRAARLATGIRPASGQQGY